MPDDLTLLTIENNGPEIVYTNYWRSDLNREGKIILSPNAGAFRVLLPECYASEILDEISDGYFANVRRGLDLGTLRQMVEIAVYDRDREPYIIQMETAACTSLPLDSDQGRDFELTFWRKEPPTFIRKAKTIRCRYQRVSHLTPPDMFPHVEEGEPGGTSELE